MIMAAAMVVRMEKAMTVQVLHKSVKHNSLKNLAEIGSRATGR